MNKEEIKDWLSTYDITNYTINDDLTVDIDEDVHLNYYGLTSLPFQFGIIKGSFYIQFNKLISLKNCPEEVHGGFWCYDNQLTSLEHCPKVVHGEFFCHDNLEKDPRYLRWLLAKKLSQL